jgi:ABC-type spermidine/putrescine transport system permease subunit II
VNVPLIPNFEPYQCHNCGLPLREMVEFCPACGARITDKSGAPRWARVLTGLVLALFMVPLMGLGSCALLFAIAPVNTRDGLLSGVIGLAMLAVAVLFGIVVTRLLNR